MRQSRQGGVIGDYLYASLLFPALFCSAVAAATPVSDEYIRGYATAMLQRDFQVTAETLSVEPGAVLIGGLEASDVVRDQMKTSLSSIKGVRQVVVAKQTSSFP